MRKRLKDFYFFAFSLGIGILAAIGALLFRILIELFQNFLWPSGMTFFDQLLNTPGWLIVLVPTCAGLLMGPVITYLVPEARGPGVPVVIASVTSRQSTIRHRVTFLKALVTSFLIGAGASVGREGPIVQIGASIGSSVAQFFRLNPDLRRVCLACGAAAGIAATFNAPIAGTLFAVEIILLDVELGHISHVIISAVTGSVLARVFWGDFPAFNVAGFQLTNHWELSIYFLLGVAAGLTAIGFVWLIYSTERLFGRLRIPDWIKPAIGGLLLGLIGLRSPHVLGVGYETVNLALTNSLILKTALLILCLKILATSLCIGSGMSGGIFAPSLLIGATLGTAVGLVVTEIIPDLGLRPSDYALVGMGAVVAGTTLAPITAILTIFEITYTYQIILPLMVACIGSAIVVRLLFGHSVYELKLIKEGTPIVRGHDISILRHMLVSEYVIGEFETLSDTMPFKQVMDHAIEAPYPHFVILDSKGELAGVLSLRDLRPYLSKFEQFKESMVAADLMNKEVVTISASDDLGKALELFEKHRISFLPVTDPDDAKRLLGIFKKDDLLRAYQEKILKSRVLSSPL